MEYFFKSTKGKPSNLKIFIYDQEFQLVYSGEFKEPNLKQTLSNCSLLFNIDNSGYFIKKS
jgi:hypothetical protein